MYETPIIRWSRGVLPKDNEIEHLPIISISKFIEEISDTSIRWQEDNKIYNPSIFTTNLSVFVDIDHIDEYFDAIWEKMDKIISDCPFIIMVKQSRSKSFHCICVGDWEDGITYSNISMFYLACIAKSILNHTGIDLRNIKNSLDTHTKSTSQRLFVYNPKLHPYILNPYPTKVSLDGINRAFEEYPMLRPEQKIITSDFNFDLDVNFRPVKLSNKILLNKNYVIAGYSGNDARWRVANALYYIFKGDKTKAKTVIEDNFENPHEFRFNSVNKGYNKGVLNWILENLQQPLQSGYNSASTIPNIDEIRNQYNVIDVTLSENEYLSDHTATIINSSTPFNYIAAGTGTGKTEFVKSLQKEGMVDLCYPMNSTMDGKGGTNIVRTRNVAGEHAIEKWESNQPLTFIVDTLVTMIQNLPPNHTKRPCVFVDESHMTISEMNYREKMSTILFSLCDYYEKVYFMSGTTWNEYELLTTTHKLNQSDITIFNCTKPQPIRTYMDWKDYTPTVTEETENGKTRKVTKSLSKHLRQLIWDNHKNNVVTVIFTDQFRSMVRNMLDNMKLSNGDYSRPTKQGETVKNINEKNTSSGLDVFQATSYMSVGVELKDERTYCFVFLDNDITAQEIQQMKERDRLGKNRVVIYRNKLSGQTEDSWTKDRESILSMVNTLNTNQTIRQVMEESCDIRNLPFIKKNETNETYTFDEDIWEVCMFADEKRQQWKGKDYIKDYFTKKGVVWKSDTELKDDDLGYMNSRKRDNTLDGNYLLEHMEEVLGMYNGLGEFETRIDWFVEYDRGGKKEPAIKDGKYWFNNTNYVLECINLLNVLESKDQQRVKDYCMENKRIINVERLKEYTEIIRIISYQKEMKVMLTHFIDSFRKLEDLTNKKQVTKMRKGEVDYFFKSKKIRLDGVDDKAADKIRGVVDKIVGGFLRFFKSHPEMVDEIYTMMKEDDEKWFGILSGTITCDIFDELYADKRTNEHKMRRVEVDGVEYQSIKAACKSMGWSEDSFKKKIPFSFKPAFAYKGHSVKLFDQDEN